VTIDKRITQIANHLKEHEQRNEEILACLMEFTSALYTKLEDAILAITGKVLPRLAIHEEKVCLAI